MSFNDKKLASLKQIITKQERTILELQCDNDVKALKIRELSDEIRKYKKALSNTQANGCV